MKSYETDVQYVTRMVTSFTMVIGKMIKRDDYRYSRRDDIYPVHRKRGTHEHKQQRPSA